MILRSPNYCVMLINVDFRYGDERLFVQWDVDICQRISESNPVLLVVLCVSGRDVFIVSCAIDWFSVVSCLADLMCA